MVRRAMRENGVDVRTPILEALGLEALGLEWTSMRKVPSAMTPGEVGGWLRVPSVVRPFDYASNSKTR